MITILSMNIALKLCLVASIFLLIIGVSHADLITDGSFESTTTYTGTRCFIANGLFDFGNCKITGSDQVFDVPLYWEMNNSIGDYSQVIDNSFTYLLGTGDYWAYSPTYGCYARNVESYSSIDNNLTLYETCDAVYGSYESLAVSSVTPFPYQETVSLTGSKSLMIHNIPTLPCGNVASSCGEKNVSTDGFVLQNVSFPDSDYALHFNVRNCDFTPSQCEESFCVVSSFGNPRNPTLGNFRVIIANESLTNIVVDVSDNAVYRDGWQGYDIYLSGVELSGNYSVGLGIDSVSSSSSICVIYDNVSIESVDPVTVPSEDYISDMNTKYGFPFSYATYEIGAGGYVTNSFTLKTSRGFDGVPIFQTYISTSRDSGSCSVVQQDHNVTLYYDNGTFFDLPIDLLNISSGGSAGSPCTWTITFEHPVPDYDNLVSIIYNNKYYATYFLNYNVTLDADLTVREVYNDTLSGVNSDEVLSGDPYLFPVIIYNNLLNDSGCSIFDAWNFKYTNEALTGNVDYTLFSGSGLPKQYGSETITFNAGTKLNDHSYCWVDMDSVDSTDYIMINFTSENYNLKSGTQTLNLSVLYPVTASAVAGCNSGCVGYTYRLATELDSGACLYDYQPLSSLCYTAPADYGEVPANYTTITDAWADSVAVVGSVSGQIIDDTSDNLPSDLKFIIAIVISLIVGSILGLKTGHWAYGLVSVIAFLCVFTVIGFIDWWIVIIIVIISTLLIAKYGAEQFTGSGK